MNSRITANEPCSSELIQYGEGDPFAAYATAMSPNTIVGKLLKFSKGDYTVGENSEEVRAGTMFVANMDEFLVAWVRWVDGKPAEHVMGRVAEQWVPPPRSKLGSTDKSDWECDKDGKPKDPWQFT